MSKITILATGWLLTALALVAVLVWHFASLNEGVRLATAGAPEAAEDMVMPPEARIGGQEEARHAVSSDGLADPIADAADPGESELYQRALARVLLPDPTGNLDADRRNGLRHRVHHHPVFTGESNFSGPTWSREQLLVDPQVNPMRIQLEDEEMQVLFGILNAEADERAKLWRARMALEGQAMERSIDAGAFEWFGENALHHGVGPDPSRQQEAFQARMTELWGPVGKGWTFFSTDVRGETLTVYATPRSSPELFRAIEACLAFHDAAIERGRRYIEGLRR